MMRMRALPQIKDFQRAEIAFRAQLRGVSVEQFAAVSHAAAKSMPALMVHGKRLPRAVAQRSEHV